jgi:hypothetical protein
MSSSSGRKRKHDSEESRQHPKKRQKIEGANPKNWDEWISATSTRNYLMNDPLVDWLGHHSQTLAFKKPRYMSRISKALVGRSHTNFNEFIMEQGKKFETRFIEYLYSKYPKDIIVDIGGDDNARSEEKVDATIKAMNKGVPIIHSGVLHNPDTKTYGVPDLLVRSDWIGEIVTLSPLTKNEAKASAPLLTDLLRDGKRPKYHYRVIDIKFTTLYLRADGIKLLNSGSIPAWKGQLWIYNTALSRIQGYEPPHAYILGRKWTFTSKGETFRGGSCVDRLGVIDFEDTDLDTVTRTKDALKWIRDVRKKGDTWDIFEVPLKRKELYPNMSNTHDYPWRPVKEMIADEIDEITDLWMCGVKNREKAHAAKIYRWTDPRCTTDILGINGPKTKRVLEKILSINRDESDTKIIPDIITNNDDEWQTRRLIEFYVDFEYLNDVMSDEATRSMPEVEATSIIFMIGAGYFDPFTHLWVYRSFTVDALTKEEELRVCTEFSWYVRQEAEWWECPNPLLIHWSPAEKWQWAGAIDRHSDGEIERIWIPVKEECNVEIDPRWFDLLQVFKKEPIVIKGCLGFSLKEVAGAFVDAEFITTTWDQDSGCTNGTSAMLAAFKASKDAVARGMKLSEMPQIQDVRKYNEVDCKVLGEIIKYLRENHTDSTGVYQPTIAQILA